MKLSLKKPKKLHKWHIFALGVFVVMTVSAATVFVARAASNDIDVARFNGSQLPNGFDMSRGGNVFMEISQKGPFNTLDAKEGWAKIYLDPTRAANGVVGIFDGYYSGCKADMNGTTGKKYSIDGVCSPDQGAVIYRFYVGIDNKPFPRDANEIYKNKIDEIPCDEPFEAVSSRDMYQDGYRGNPKNGSGWYQVALKDFANKKCEMKPTSKSGKIVIFVHAFWKDSNNTEGRINAFKVGGAYGDSKSPASALTGYWSKLNSATRPVSLLDFDTGSGVYAVQDRRTPQEADQSFGNANGWTQGDYNFSFGPDCDIPRGTQDPKKRYIKWYDVDYSTDTSKSFYNGKRPPSMRLVDKTVGKVVTDADTGQPISFSGTQLGGPDTPKGSAFYGIGGHLYAWEWKDMIASDGVVFWMPYDDYPSLNGGCGTYNQGVELQGGRGDGWSTNDFEVAGGDTVTFMVRGKYLSGNSAAPTSTFGAHLVSQPGSPYDATFTSAGPISISDDGYKKGGSRANIEWVKPGMGPSDPYSSQRDLTFAYQVKDDAQNGAKHCFNADLTPLRSAAPTESAYSKTICITINNSLKPYVSTSGADVHAGDCTLLDKNGKFIGTDGKVTGQVTPSGSKGSSGSYIVSAGDAITSFGSGGAPNGGALTFGKGGKYGAVCRPTIDAISTYFQKDTAAVWPTPAEGTALDLNALPAGGRYKVIFPSGGRVTGQSKATVTLYAANGTITVDGPPNSTVGSNMGQAAVRDKLPVVGMIARDIKINPNVTAVNAVMYATYDIDTCAVSNWTAQCKSLLTIKGFAMARTFSFKRVSASANGLQKGEQIDFNAAFYLNPPPGFGDQSKLLKYLGERAPLY